MLTGTMNVRKRTELFSHSRYWSHFLWVALYLKTYKTCFGIRNWVFASNSDVLILIFLQPDVVHLIYFKLWILLYQISLKYLRSTTLGCKDIRIRNSEFVAKTNCLLDFNVNFFKKKTHYRILALQNPWNTEEIAGFVF